MTLPDSSAVDEALVQRLETDPDLAALIPDGVSWDVAPPNVTTCITVSLVEAVDDWSFQAAEGSGEERLVYEVLAITMDTSGEDSVRTAAARIHTLLHGETVLTIAGFDCLAMLRQGRVHRTRVDLLSDVRWMQRGGRYQVIVQPLVSGEEITHGATTR